MTQDVCNPIEGRESRRERKKVEVLIEKRKRAF